MESKAKEQERTVLITLEVPADIFGFKVIRRDTAGYESEEYVYGNALGRTEPCRESEELGK